ncbi:hypothetical protein E2H86_09625 [Pseudomonas putida]|nr:hypothetical protein E2H86_09625 [Pseudomonas putida]
MRRVSTADARPMVVKLGKIRKPKVCGAAGAIVAQAGWAIAIFLYKLGLGGQGSGKTILACFFLSWAVLVGQILHPGTAARNGPECKLKVNVVES